MIKIWGIDIINPIEEGRNYLKKINKYKEPFFSFSCDGHYSKLVQNLWQILYLIFF